MSIFRRFASSTAGRKLMSHPHVDGKFPPFEKMVLKETFETKQHAAGKKISFSSRLFLSLSRWFPSVVAVSGTFRTDLISYLNLINHRASLLKSLFKKGSVVFWKRFNIFVTLPLLILTGAYVLPHEMEHIHHLEEHPREFIPYSYIRKRKSVSFDSIFKTDSQFY